jgi:pimeloyl-ACP methyl ester carboxylesterase
MTRRLTGLVASLLILGAQQASPSSAVTTLSVDCGSNLLTRQAVLLVHGYNSAATTWSQDARSYLASNLGKTCVATFDYSGYSTHWVTDDHVGPALADSIQRLAQRSKAEGGTGKVILIGHSMGGLAIRCAVAPSCSGVEGIASEVAAVATFGTPNLGTFLKGYGASDAADLLGPLLSGGCRGASVLIPVMSCATIKALGTSRAAKAFTPGSADLKALPAMPASIPLLAVAGSVKVQSSFWGRAPHTISDVGDMVVSEDSALAEARSIGGIGGTRTVDCGSIDVSEPVSTSLLCTHVSETSYSGFLVQALSMIGKVEKRDGVKEVVVAQPRPVVTQAPPVSPAAQFTPGAPFVASCVNAWPTAPSYTSTSITMTMSCSGVPSKYLFVQVIYGDPNFPIRPSTGRVSVRGRVVDVARSAYGYSELLVEATTVTIP